MRALIWVLIIIVIAVGAYFLIQEFSSDTDVVDNDVDEDMQDPTDDDEVVDDEDSDRSQTVLGTSAEGREITAHHYGNGDTELLFVGGIHGGYSWNTVLVARELMDYLESNQESIPENIRATVVPLLNPDGLNDVVGTTGSFTRADVPNTREATVPGRFNGNGVDLNRNFDCDWQSVGMWQDREVDAGDSAFSEPEAQAIRDYVNAAQPDAVVVWYSAVGGVFASNCHNGVLDETLTITNLYADASGYPSFEEFNFYEITGDMVNWLAKQNIPAISVLLTTHEDVEWNKNRRGVEALFDHYGQE